MFTGSERYLMNQVRVEKVEAVERHPNADRLDIVCTGYPDKELALRFVVGRDYVSPGDIVMTIQSGPALTATKEGQWAYPYVKKLRNGHYVKDYFIRGEWSAGMCVRLDELPLEGVSDFEKYEIWPVCSLSLCSRVGIVAPNVF